MDRTMVEVTRETRARLRLVAAKKQVTMKQLLDDLSRRAEEEAFSAPPTPPRSKP